MLSGDVAWDYYSLIFIQGYSRALCMYLMYISREVQEDCCSSA